jgi:hypothetical protein
MRVFMKAILGRRGYVRLEVLEAVTTKSSIFWDMKPYSLVVVIVFSGSESSLFLLSFGRILPDYTGSLPRRQ